MKSKILVLISAALTIGALTAGFGPMKRHDHDSMDKHFGCHQEEQKTETK